MVNIIQDFIPVVRRNRPGYKLDPRWITIHDTANTQTGADAAAHARYLKNQANLEASWHFTVDDKVIYQHLPLDENGWHAGDGANGPGNRQSIGIEICENRDGDRALAEKNAAWLTARLLEDFNLNPERVKQHHDWSGKNCPRVLRGRPGGWSGFLYQVQQQKSTAAPTPIIGDPEATVGQAQDWARKRLAHRRFIEIAPSYWYYGGLTGIRPEVLYAQSARETAFGRYGGIVHPDQNNWAGIKTAGATGDRREDHESFSTPQEGVRAHFNHICAYVGLEPVGEPHGRYWVVKQLPWAGSVKGVEELGGKWSPAADYGIVIVRDYLNELLATAEPPAPPPEETAPPPEPQPPETPEPQPPETPEPEEPGRPVPLVIRWLLKLWQLVKRLMGLS